ncbi:GNAT family N-acetyltransferase [Pseudovibrio sp. Alg231-02]|uniref:GNAT family N-acetyltransferase n=1 Tax=Pseudovibrio sp. Alg231-02 TaxID=1922223 RepID=UPI000D562729|nr:GNAT family N-acetyltransferase [Pseudovibrio sp. Alg231-02]
MKYPIASERLSYRLWEECDLGPFACMSADQVVMRHMAQVMDRKGAMAFIKRTIAAQAQNGVSLLPVTLKSSGEFLGAVGLNIPNYGKPLPFDPCIEIGWRFKRSAWGNGYATEAAAQWLRFAFEELDLEEIVAFTIPANIPSQKVMERLGMKRDLNGDFLHPALDQEHPKARHVLYRLNISDWRIRNPALNQVCMT